MELGAYEEAVRRFFCRRFSRTRIATCYPYHQVEAPLIRTSISTCLRFFLASQVRVLAEAHRNDIFSLDSVGATATSALARLIIAVSLALNCQQVVTTRSVVN